MRLDNKIYVVCDANGECKGLYSNYDEAGKAADWHGAYVSSHIEVLDVFDKERAIRGEFDD